MQTAFKKNYASSINWVAQLSYAIIKKSTQLMVLLGNSEPYLSQSCML